MDDVFWELTEELRHEAAHEARAQADATVAAARRQRTFRDEVADCVPGDAVAVSLTDGAMLHGRIVGVGADWVRIAEVQDALGAARARTRRIHDVRIGAIVRLVREVEA